MLFAHLAFSATFFFQNGVAGACGTVHQDSDLIAAIGSLTLVLLVITDCLIDQNRYGNSGLKSELCGQKVKITNPANNKVRSAS